MTRQELITQSESTIRSILKGQIPLHAQVFLYGSRARRDHRWNSDYDLWIDGDLSTAALRQLGEQLDESFVPFNVDIVTTPKLKGRFAEQVKQEAILWM